MWIIAELKWVTRTWHKTARPYPQQYARCHWNSLWRLALIYPGENYLCTTKPLLHHPELSSRGRKLRYLRQGVLCFLPGNKKRFATCKWPWARARSCREQLLCEMLHPGSSGDPWYPCQMDTLSPFLGGRCLLSTKSSSCSPQAPESCPVHGTHQEIAVWISQLYSPEWLLLFEQAG